jgi:localization factor PodJL
MIAAQSVKGGKDKGERPIDATAQPPAGAGQMAAVAVGPQVALPPGLVEPASAPNAQVNALYMDAVRRIEAKEYRAVADLRRAADAGHPQAQFYLAKLYEGGEAGLRKDLAEARRWTERAAQNGDRKAMHNLGLYYFEGTGGPKNATAAAQWFRRASDLGLLDSQFNLARLYEEGFGVGQNPAEAYKWYLIGARSGDGESRAAAERVKARLSPQARAAAERAAAVFRPDLSAAAPSAVAAAPAAASPNANFTLAQRALSRLGYYRGPQDGAPSPALQLAIQAYQRENGLPPTGAVDGALAARFAVVAG